MVKIPKDNDENERKLIELIKSGEAILIVGAGISKLVGYPIWSELIRILEHEVEKKEKFFNSKFEFRKHDSNENDLKYASRLKKFLGKERYSHLIHQIFDDKRCDESHLALLQLPFRAILTTNYDQTLEIALLQLFNTHDNSIVIDESFSNREILRFFQSLNFGYAGNKKIVHLHGVFKQINTVVLCQDDYLKKYSSEDPKSDSWTLHKRIIWSLMATRRIIYIGFSLNDPFFEMMHSIVSKEIGLFNSETHYMISRFSVDDTELKQTPNQTIFAEKIKYSFGIQTVFFEDDSSYQGLKKYVLELKNKFEVDLREDPIKLIPVVEPAKDRKKIDNSSNDALIKNTLRKISDLKGK